MSLQSELKALLVDFNGTESVVQIVGMAEVDGKMPTEYNNTPCSATIFYRRNELSTGNCFIEQITPIFHHLSDLTKDEWIDRLNTFACELLDAAHVYDEKNIIGLNWMTQPFEIVMWLVKNHFNLMDESEPFIDVNTLEINPYK